MKAYLCEKCGDQPIYLDDPCCTPVCCGDAMKELVPNAADAAAEKHLPVIEADGSTVTVKVSEVTHPMAEKHYIVWIAIETTDGFQFKSLTPGDAPEAVFALADGVKLVAAYDFCNLHGLWKTEA